MTDSIKYSCPDVSSRVQQRLAQLSLPLLRLTAEGSLTPLTEPTWFQDKFITWPGFQEAVKQHWHEIRANEDKLIELFAGVSLLPLAPSRRRRPADQLADESQMAVLFIGVEVLNSQTIHRLCAFHELDYEQTRNRIGPGGLIAQEQATRLSRFILWMHQDTKITERHSTDILSMGQELAASYEELNLLYKLSDNMAIGQSSQVFLKEICHELQQVLNVNWVALRLTDDEPRLKKLVGKVFTAGQAGHHHIVKRAGRMLLHRFENNLEPIIVDDTALLNMPEISELTKAMLIVPLHLQDRPLGILLAGDKIDQTQISSVEAKLCNSMGHSLAIFLDNRMLYEDMRTMFLGTLRALSSAIDAKDSYTHGHSERVATMAQMLAQAVGLDKSTCGRIQIAGMVHDIGKIGVPETVLCKKGKLTDEEFELIKRHPEIGARILQDIDQMSDVIPGVMYHHERWDGKGYPQQLAGEKIPLFGRILCLADSFDAMSSNRTYRSALGHEKVLEEINACAGRQFDPELAKIFVQLDFAPFAELAAKQQQN